MHETMKAAPGVGLAATQVGRLLRMFVYDAGEEGGSGTLCNPEITWRSDETQEAEEGCLSLPGTYYPVVRALKVKMRAQDVTGYRGQDGQDHDGEEHAGAEDPDAEGRPGEELKEADRAAKERLDLPHDGHDDEQPP